MKCRREELSMRHRQLVDFGALGGRRLVAFVVALVIALTGFNSPAADSPLKIVWRTHHETDDDPLVYVSTWMPMAFSDDSKLLAVGRGHDVIVYETAGGRVVSKTNAADLQQKLNADFAKDRCPGYIAFSPDGTLLATTIPGGRTVDGKRMAEIYLWEASTGRYVGRLPGHEGTDIDGLIFSKNSEDPNLRLISMGRDGYNRLWNVTRREEIFAFEAPLTSEYRGSEHYSNHDSARFTQDGKTLLTAANFEIATRIAGSGVPLSRYSFSERSGSVTAPLMISSDGKYAALFGDMSGVQAWPGAREFLSVVNLTTRESRPVEKGRRVTLAEFGAVSSRLYLLMNDSVECRKPDDWSVVYSTQVSSGEAMNMAVSADESTLGIVDSSEKIRCFAVETAGLKHLGTTGEESDFSRLLLSPDGKYVAGSSHWAAEVVVYEVPRP
jgi:WD40 repeat protein